MSVGVLWGWVCTCSGEWVERVQHLLGFMLSVVGVGSRQQSLAPGLLALATLQRATHGGRGLLLFMHPNLTVAASVDVQVVVQQTSQSSASSSTLSFKSSRQ